MIFAIFTANGFRMNMSKPSWLEYKGGLGFDFPNLPYYQVLPYIQSALLSGTAIYSIHIINQAKNLIRSYIWYHTWYIELCTNNLPYYYKIYYSKLGQYMYQVKYCISHIIYQVIHLQRTTAFSTTAILILIFQQKGPDGVKITQSKAILCYLGRRWHKFIKSETCTSSPMHHKYHVNSVSLYLADMVLRARHKRSRC